MGSIEGLIGRDVGLQFVTETGGECDDGEEGVEWCGRSYAVIESQPRMLGFVVIVVRVGVAQGWA